MISSTLSSPFNEINTKIENRKENFIMLNNRQRKMLRFLYRKGKYNAVKFYKKFKISEVHDEEYEKLVTKEYIRLDSSNSSRKKHTVAIIEKGITAVEAVQKGNFRFWIPVIISIIALLRPEITKLISYISNLIAKLG